MSGCARAWQKFGTEVLTETTLHFPTISLTHARNTECAKISFQTQGHPLNDREKLLLNYENIIVLTKQRAMCSEKMCTMRHLGGGMRT